MPTNEVITMKKFLALSLFFAFLGMGILCGSAYFCLASLNKDAIMVSTPTAAADCSEHLMAAIQDGRYETASGHLYGQVDLGLDREPADDLGKLIWDALKQSFRYEFIGDCYATATGVARDVWITTLNPASLNLNLSQRVEELAEAGEIYIYDEEGNIQEAVLNQLLQDALSEALVEDAASTTRKVQLNLVYQNGQWWVVPDEALLQAISGGMAG